MPTARSVFDSIHEIESQAERKAYLDRVCADSPEVRQRVEALLRAYEEAGSSFLKVPPDRLSATGPYVPGSDAPSPSSGGPSGTTVDTLPPSQPMPSTIGPGSQIGPYRLVKPLGEGGMGAVYLAEQEQPIRRQVAIKFIRPDMAGPHFVARFEAERQALTLMDHANIARVHDAATTDAGLPYLVMELVPGEPITRYCNDHALTLRERLELFVPVCQAIQHAHQKGIIHRDIKPGNVLVCLKDGQPVPKVIDFGVAKATDQPLTDQSKLTEAGAIIGTLKYMSPEQADVSAAGIDTRTDVYALGVMLYELLTGTTPLDGARGAGLIDLVVRIKEDETPRPSDRVAGLGERLPAVAEQRQTEPARLANLLRGELDWIALRALEKDRERRYPTASSFADDVQSYLDDEPVAACPPSTRYRLGKFARKHRALLATVGGFVGLLVLGVVGLTWGIFAVNGARQRAVTAEKRTRNALDTTAATFETLSRGSVKLTEYDERILRNVAHAYGDFLRDLGAGEGDPSIAAELQLTQANVNMALHETQEAEAGYRAAIQRYEQLANDSPAETTYRSQLAKCHYNLAVLLYGSEKLADAEQAYRRALELYEKLASEAPDEPEHRRGSAEVLNNLAALLRDRDELPAAEKACRQAVALKEQLVREKGDDVGYKIELAASYHNLGNMVRDRGDANASLPWYGKAIELLTPIDPRPPEAMEYLCNAHWDRANARGQLLQHDDALKDWQSALAVVETTRHASLQQFLEAARTEVRLKAAVGLTGNDLYKAAEVNAQARTAAEAVSEARQQQQYADRALNLLTQARTAGFFNDPQHVKQLSENKEFDKLPAEPFQAFLKGLKAGPAAKDQPAKN